MLSGQLIMGIATIAVATVAALIRSYRREDGLINRALEDKRTANEAHATIPELVDQVEAVHGDVGETKALVEEIDAEVTTVERALVVIHQDDPDVNTDALRERLDVETLDEDLVDGEE